jgi:hypothetical protein
VKGTVVCRGPPLSLNRHGRMTRNSISTQLSLGPAKIQSPTYYNPLHTSKFHYDIFFSFGRIDSK